VACTQRTFSCPEFLRIATKKTSSQPSSIRLDRPIPIASHLRHLPSSFISQFPRNAWLPRRYAYPVPKLPALDAAAGARVQASTPCPRSTEAFFPLPMISSKFHLPLCSCWMRIECADGFVLGRDGLLASSTSPPLRSARSLIY